MTRGGRVSRPAYAEPPPDGGGAAMPFERFSETGIDLQLGAWKACIEGSTKGKQVNTKGDS